MEEPADTKMLQLQILEGLALAPGTQIMLNSRGLVGSKRKSKDKCAYFGTMNTDVQF